MHSYPFDLIYYGRNGVEKMIKRVFTIVLVLLLLTSCSANKGVSDSNKNDGISYPPADTKGTHAVYFPTSCGVYPVNVCVNGNCILADDVYYYNLTNFISKDENIKSNTFTVFDANGHNKGAVPFSELEGENCKLDSYSALVTSGNWRLCPDMRVVEYNKETSAPAEYTDFLSQNFEGKQFEIQRLWETDIDLDGNNEAVFTGVCEDTSALAVMSSSLGNKVVATCIAKDGILRPYFADFNGDGKSALAVLSGDGLKTLSVYKDCTLDTAYTLYLPIGS